MVGSYFLLPALLAFLFSLLVVRAGAIALMLTGVEGASARFQSLSAYTGTGFTTREAEMVMQHPTRRRIIAWLIITGNIGIITVIVSTTSSLVASRGYQIPLNAVLLAVGALVVYFIATRRWFARRWERFIENRLVKSRTLEEAPVENLLHLFEGYGLLRGIVDEASPLAGGTLAELRLTERGVLVLGIERKRHWMPTPRPDEVIQKGDRVVVYGPLDTLRSTLEGKGDA